MKNELQVLWRLQRWQLLWLFLCVLAGVIAACIVMTNPLMSHNRISTSLIDSNIINSTYPNATIWSFLFARLFDVGLGLLFLFIACLHKWTVFLCFPYLALRGYALALNLYWIISRFGVATGILLLISYAVFLIIVTIVFVCATLFIMCQCADIRRNGARIFKWACFFRQLAVFVIILVAVALTEWLVYAVVLSKLIFPIVI